ncbi:glycoside hydrolase family 16 protein [Neobacillus rhizosphaerae]|uniref:glycoside hydrolase family 16 protein n=1 Tax=Neobacillus rhizosphaerae TaxID=2880965 RepID=UPI003D2881A8
MESKKAIPNEEMSALSSVELQSDVWNLVWEERFTGEKIDETNWNYTQGGWGFGNDELQYYTAREENARIENNLLILEAKQEKYEGMNYTSAKLTTKGKATWKYGRFEIRAKLPEGQGIWPAIWMMPEDMELYSGWPACGEIDIMELIGHQPGTVYGTLHYGMPHTYTGENYSLPGNKKFSEDFHIFTLDWEPDEFRWYVDGVLYAKQNKWFSNHKETGSEHPGFAPFDRPFYLQVNLAVGGKWPGNPDDSTCFPQKMEIDYIKVFQKIAR